MHNFKTNSSKSVTNGCCQCDKSCLTGWTQDDSYRIRRSGRAERGVRAHSPAWSERPTPN
ncbi:hypothetical protein CHH35_29380 [Escherichia coli O157:H7]|nr:hypothetical protein CHH35_29380 [Escherichia coli O157:H7]